MAEVVADVPQVEMRSVGRLFVPKINAKNVQSDDQQQKIALADWNSSLYLHVL